MTLIITKLKGSCFDLLTYLADRNHRWAHRLACQFLPF